jgi:ribosomal protein S18 acetylase RimI-like enzyme
LTVFAATDTINHVSAVARNSGRPHRLGARLMGLTYYKRFRMEIDLRARDFSRVSLPQGYRFVGWHPSLVEAHAEIKYLSFRTEIDSSVFPCLGDYPGCLRLMNEICHKPGFLPQATWLVATSDTESGVEEYCGTVQGVTDPSRLGAIQNLGILAEHRGRGLGHALMLKALDGFKRAGLLRAFLEVTSQNGGAIRLYRRLGFSKVRTVYKVIEAAYS